MRLSWLAAALCALSFTTALSAQGGREPTEHIRREIDSRQQAMREGRVVRSNVRITLRLRNGSRMKGVVKDGRFVERPQGLEFLPTEMSEEDAGIRLWYYDNTNSFIFLPYATIAYHKIGDRLTDDEVRRIAAELDRAAADQARVKADPTVTKDKPAGGAETPAEGASDAPVLSDEQRALLTEFPPEQGWGYDRMRELEARKIRIGVYPNETEQRFLDSFEAWNQAFQLWQQIEAAKQNAAPEGETAPAAGEASTGETGLPTPTPESTTVPAKGSTAGKTQAKGGTTKKSGTSSKSSGTNQGRSKGTSTTQKTETSESGSRGPGATTQPVRR